MRRERSVDSRIEWIENLKNHSFHDNIGTWFFVYDSQLFSIASPRCCAVFNIEMIKTFNRLSRCWQRWEIFRKNFNGLFRCVEKLAKKKENFKKHSKDVEDSKCFVSSKKVEKLWTKKKCASHVLNAAFCRVPRKCVW